MIHFREIETKYDASSTGLEAFCYACESIPNAKLIEVSSYDHYYTLGDKAIRYRDGKDPQITMKEKTSTNNNFKRIEVNLDLNKRVRRDTVDQLCEMLGFKHNFSIYKKSTIYKYDNYNTVFYVVYDEERVNELGRFIEIEMSETYPWSSEDEAWQELLKIEQSLSLSCIAPKRRLKKSLFEMYRK